MMSNCCNTYLPFKKYKELKMKEGFWIENFLKDTACVNCYFLSLYGTIDENQLKLKMNERIKKRYNENCNCGVFYPYKNHIENIKEGTCVAPMMPLYSCVNCYILKRYGTLDKETLKKIRVEEALKRNNERKIRKEALKKIKEMENIEKEN